MTTATTHSTSQADSDLVLTIPVEVGNGTTIVVPHWVTRWVTGANSMPITIEQLITAVDRFTDEERAELQKIVEAQRFQMILDGLRKEGKGIEWDGKEWVLCDVPGLNSRYKQQQEKRPQTINPFLPSGDVPSPSCSPILAVNASIWGAASGKKGWKEQDGMGPQFTHTNKNDTAKFVIEYNPTKREAAIDDALAKSLWKGLEHFSDRDIDAFAIALAYAAHASGESVWIFGSDILDHRSITPKMQSDGPRDKKRDAGHRKEDIIPYGQSFARLSDIWVTISQVINDDALDKQTKRRKKRVFTCDARLLTIEQVWFQKELDSETGQMIDGHAIGWKIRVGDWLTTYLNFPNRQIGVLSKQILSYDPYRETWPKRLAYYFFVHGHASNPTGGAVTLRRDIGDLLTQTGLDIDERDPMRTRTRFEKAMDRLDSDGIFNEWRYQDKGAVKDLPSKRWLKQWLDQQIVIEIAPRNALPAS